jgi:ATP:corrinoid adenosyltransferase
LFLFIELLINRTALIVLNLLITHTLTGEKLKASSKRRKSYGDKNTKGNTEATSKKGLNLSSVSVIIFDEVSFPVYWGFIQLCAIQDK